MIGSATEPHLRAELVLAVPDMALAQRRRTHIIQHSDDGCQYTAVAVGKRVDEAGGRPSIGSVDDALMATVLPTHGYAAVLLGSG